MRMGFFGEEHLMRPRVRWCLLCVLLVAAVPGSPRPIRAQGRSPAGGSSRPTPSATDLERGFADPPLGARTRCFWWWLNGNVTKAAITRDLEQLQAKGFGGALIFDAGGAEQR